VKIRLHAFAHLRDYLPPGSRAHGEVDLELPEPATVKDVFILLGLERRLGAQIFDAPVEHAFQVLVNRTAVQDYSHALADGDEVSMFPPMAGG